MRPCVIQSVGQVCTVCIIVWKAVKNAENFFFSLLIYTYTSHPKYSSPVSTVQRQFQKGLHTDRAAF